jgi:hypothetical protein
MKIKAPVSCELTGAFIRLPLLHADLVEVGINGVDCAVVIVRQLGHFHIAQMGLAAREL